MLPSPQGPQAKQHGAYYTAKPVADFLIQWAVRSGEDSVLDPSFGGGVFLQSALEHLTTLKAQSPAVFGVEMDQQAFTQVKALLPQSSLIHADFFTLRPAGSQGVHQLKPIDALVGNPPFIRYQRFKGEERRAALACAAELGVTLNQRVSAWVPFVVHGVRFLRLGGRLAMVVPSTLGYASYTQPLLPFLRDNFSHLTIISSQTLLFPKLDQDTLLLLASGKGKPHQSLHYYTVAGVHELPKLLPMSQPENLHDTAIQQATPFAECVDIHALICGDTTLRQCGMHPSIRGLYKALAQHPQVLRLGEVAQVTTGYVTGANHFFHLDMARLKRWQLPQGSYRQTVFRGKAFTGLTFTEEDWCHARKHAQAGFLFAPVDHAPRGWGTLSQAIAAHPQVQAYIRHGERKGVPKAYKCRTRKPWYEVRRLLVPDAFLTYMSGLTPYIVTNNAGVVASNTLHLLKLHDSNWLSALALSALWHTSLAQLSAELEGHALGGGMLKLEPTCAQRTLIPCPTIELEDLAQELDALLRAGKHAQAQQLADQRVLCDGLGLSECDVRLLQKEGKNLKMQRYYRKRVSLAV